MDAAVYSDCKTAQAELPITQVGAETLRETGVVVVKKTVEIDAGVVSIPVIDVVPFNRGYPSHRV